MVYSTLILLAQPDSPAAGNPIIQFLPILAIIAIFYFLVFMPMQRQKKQQQKMLRELKNGSTVLTSGGLVGTIVTINSDDTLIVRVKPDNIKLQIARSSVSGLVGEEVKKA
jgi:preprotein translocase subunit YajC